jgi:diacylglycerol kinase (ATP)
VSERSTRSSPTGWARAFGDAFRGLAQVLRTQPSAWVHAAATLAVVAAGLLVGVSRLDWGLLALALAAVWTAEILNTAVEWLGDAVTKDAHPLVGAAKDAAAGAVVVAATGAVVVGIVVFGPRLLELWGR